MATGKRMRVRKKRKIRVTRIRKLIELKNRGKEETPRQERSNLILQ
jgi:hypothetical protein